MTLMFSSTVLIRFNKNKVIRMFNELINNISHMNMDDYVVAFTNKNTLHFNYIYIYFIF